MRTRRASSSSSSPPTPLDVRSLAPGDAYDTADAVLPGDSEAVERAVLARNACRMFDPDRPLSEEVLNRILAATLRAPSGFNTQPYQCIVVQDDAARQDLSAATLRGNVRRVLSAPVTVVFAADLDPMQRITELMDLERGAGNLPDKAIRELPVSVGAFAGALGLEAVQAAKRLAFGLLSVVEAMPAVSNLDAWAYKNTMLAVQTMMIAAASHGVSSHPMEGFDARRVREALNLPSRFEVPVIVSLGYAAEPTGKSPRYAAESMVHRDSYGIPYEGVPEW